ncbi:ankyrin repeat domain-containing protein [Gammaproteobacteria bacterium]|nr:ankyrin repeat domain-containing protein [Gammaproteobacteria bacterium]
MHDLAHLSNDVDLFMNSFRPLAAVLLGASLSACISISGIDLPEESIVSSAIRGDLADVKAYLEKGTDPNYLDSDRDSALMASALWGYFDMAEVLLEAGADPNIADLDHSTALIDIASFDRDNDYAFAELLLENGADPNAKDEDGDTAAHWFLFSENDSASTVLPLLVKYGADVDAQNYAGMTPLLHAVRHRHDIDNSREIIDFLLSETDDINITDEDGWSALDFICDDSESAPYDYDLVVRLVESGIDYAKSDFVALADCERHEKTEIAEFLRSQ